MLYNILGTITNALSHYSLELLESDGSFYFRVRAYQEDNIYDEDWLYTQSSVSKNFLKEVENLKKSFIRNKKIEELLANP